MPTWLLDWRLWLAAAAAGAAMTAYVQTVRLNGCQAELKGARAQLSAAGSMMEAQNMAVDELVAESAAQAARGALEASKAKADGVRLRGQADILRQALNRTDRKPSACPAGDAVKEVRRALAHR